MRKFFILLTLFFMTFLLQGLAVEAGTSQFSQGAVLLAIGFVILAAYTLSEVGSSFTLPQVTGYILTGLLLGPYALKILTAEVVQEIKIFNTLAIGLIAITAGLELHFSSLKKVALAIGSTTGLKIVTLLIFITGSLFGVYQGTDWLPMESTSHLIGLAFVLAALCIGTSPAIALAVLSESKAKGRMSQLILGSAIVKDVVVVIALALALSVAKILVGGAGSPGDAFYHLMVELFHSVLAGMVLGTLFILYIRYVGQEMFLFLLAMILATSEISRAVHLELLLVFIISGIIVRNFSKVDKVLHESLERVSLPVFVVFFTNVGAGLNLQTTWTFLPIAGLLFAARALAFFVSSWISGIWHKEKASLRNNVWLGYLPQAGVTLGLIGIAMGQWPEQATMIENIGMGLVTLNLLIGPICLRWALKQSHEIPAADSPIVNLPHQNSSSTSPTEDVTDFDKFIKTTKEQIDSKEVAEHFAQISNSLYQVFKNKQMAQLRGLLQSFINELNTIYDFSEKNTLDKLDNHFSRMGDKGKDIYSALQVYQSEIEASVISFNVPFIKGNLEVSVNDSYFMALKKRLHSFFGQFSTQREREIPFRKLAKYHFEPFVSAFTLDLLNSWYRMLSLHIDNLLYRIEENPNDIEGLIVSIQSENERWLHNSESDFIAGFKNLAQTFMEHIRLVNTVALPQNSIRYSDVEPVIKEHVDSCGKNSAIWREKFQYCRNRMKVLVQSAHIGLSLEKLLDEKFFNAVDEAHKNAIQLADDVFVFFSDLEGELPEKLQKTENNLQPILPKLLEKTNAFKINHLQAEMKTKYVRGSFRLLNREISLNLKKAIENEEGSLLITSSLTPPHMAIDPHEIVVKKINLNALVEQSFLISFLPLIEDKVEGLSNYFESLFIEMEQAFSILSYTLDNQATIQQEGATSLSSERDFVEGLRAIIQNEREKIGDIAKGLENFIEESKVSAKRLSLETQLEVRQGLERSSTVTSAKNQFRYQVNSLFEKAHKTSHKSFQYLRSIYKKVKHYLQNFEEREIDQILHQKIRNYTLDTATIRQFIDETYQIDFGKNEIPRVYYRLFSLDAVQDKRFFIANDHVWKYFKPTQPKLTFQEGHKTLVLGSRGIGKTSLLNVAQMEFQTERLVRIEGYSFATPLRTLAQQLGCTGGARAILKNLKEKSITIVIDNIEQLMNKDQIDDFSEFLEIIKQSSHNCHWLVSLTDSNFEAFDKAFKLRSIFNKIIDLNVTTLPLLKEVILSRHRLSGLGLEFPNRHLTQWTQRLGLSDRDDLFFQILHERSRGHLRQALFLWQLSMSHSDGKNLFFSMDKGIVRGLPFINQLNLLQKFILAQIYKLQRQKATQLTHTLGESKALIDNELQYLEYSGLLVPRGIDRQSFEIPNHLVFLVGQELMKEGVLHGK